MLRYLDPKNDLTFKKIFGEHPDLLICFLNVLISLESGQLIENIDYRTINKANTDEVIKGLEFVMVEFTKFRAEKWSVHNQPMRL